MSNFIYANHIHKMAGTYMKPIDFMPVAIMMTSQPSHRVYYSCVENPATYEKKPFICKRGYDYTNPNAIHKHVCVFSSATLDGLDRQFEKKYPECKVLPSLADATK